MRHDEQYLGEITAELFNSISCEQDVDECKAVARAYAEGYLDWIEVEDESCMPGEAGLYLVRTEFAFEVVELAGRVTVMELITSDSGMKWYIDSSMCRVTHYMPYKIEMPK